MSAIWQAIITVAGGLTIVAWITIALKVRQLSEDVNDIAGDPFIDASAVQISQVADQSMLEAAAWIAGGVGASAVFAILAVWAFALR